MNDLHKPLGNQQTDSKGRNWVGPALGCAAVALLSLLAYIFIDSREQTKTVVALNDAKTVTQPSAEPAAVTPAEPEAPAIGLNPDGTVNLDKVKPLSPLTPLEPDSEPLAEKPAFKPKPQPPKRLSDWVPVPDLVEKSEFGSLPKVSNGGIRPLDAYSRSSGVMGANRVALILGGLGLSQTGTQSAIRSLPSSITLGFSPFGNSLQRWMQDARREGHEVVLQLPMEPLGYPAINPGPQTLTSVATPGENLKNLRWALGRMTNYPLVMNYLGAGLTSKPGAMRPVLEEVQKRGLGYIDDGSATASTAVDLSKSLRLPHAQGNLVIDTNRNADRIRANLLSLESLAKSRGYAIGTASAFPETVEIVKKWAEQARQRGIIIVPASNLLKDYKR